MMNTMAAASVRARGRSIGLNGWVASVLPHRGQRAFPPDGSGGIRWSRSQSGQATVYVAMRRIKVDLHICATIRFALLLVRINLRSGFRVGEPRGGASFGGRASRTSTHKGGLGSKHAERGTAEAWEKRSLLPAAQQDPRGRVNGTGREWVVGPELLPVATWASILLLGADVQVAANFNW